MQPPPQPFPQQLQNQQQYPPQYPPQQSNQIQITSKSSSCCFSPKQYFDFAFLDQDPRLSALGLSTECLAKFNTNYRRHVIKTRICSWGIVVVFLIVAALQLELNMDARMAQRTIPAHYKCNQGMEISPLSTHPNPNVTDLYCCDITMDLGATLEQVRQADCVPVGGETLVDTVDLNAQWKLSSVAVACKLELNMGVRTSCNCKCVGASCECPDNLFALSSSTKINYNQAFKRYDSVIDNVITFTMVVCYLGTLAMSFVIPFRNRTQLDRLVVSCFTPWIQRCGSGMACNLVSNGCCGNAYCNSKATLTLQFPFVQLPLQQIAQQQQQQQQQGIGGINRPSFVTGSLVQIAPVQQNALNYPGKWDVFISHTQRNPEGKLLALDLHSQCAKLGKTSWLDVKMNNMSMDAMREGVQNSSCVIAVITDSCVTADDNPSKGGPEQNMYFNRWMCIQELKWAKEAGIPIQPIIRAEDKKKIGDFIQIAPEEFKYLGGVDWKHVDRSNRRYFSLGVEMVLEGVQDLLTQKRLREEMLRSDTCSSIGSGANNGQTEVTGEQKV